MAVYNKRQAAFLPQLKAKMFEELIECMVSGSTSTCRGSKPSCGEAAKAHGSGCASAPSFCAIARAKSSLTLHWTPT